MSKIKHVIPQQVVSPPPIIPTQLVGTVIPVPPKRHLQPDNLTTARRFSRLDISTTTCQSILETSSYYSYLIVASSSSSFLFFSVTASFFHVLAFSSPFLLDSIYQSRNFFTFMVLIFFFLFTIREAVFSLATHSGPPGGTGSYRTVNCFTLRIDTPHVPH